MQEQESAAARGGHSPESAHANQDTKAKPARLTPPIPLCEELIVKKRDGFVIAYFLDAKVRNEALFQEVQRRPLQLGKEIGTRQ
jgi:hypothetical protein